MQIVNNCNIRKYNTLNISYICKILIKVFNVNELMTAKIICNVLSINTIIIGNGSKIAFDDEYINSVIILLMPDNKYQLENDKLFLYSGNKLKDVILNMMKLNYGGFHKLSYIPCSISGAIYMNAGIMDCSIGDFVHKIVTLDNENNIKIYDKNDCSFSYRNSIFKTNNETILIVAFNFKRINKQQILTDIKNEYIERFNNQGIYKYSCGSLFKNLNDIKVYKLIKQLNLDNLKINDLHFSSKHCNILVNDGNATYNDLLYFISIIKNEALLKLNKAVELELNVISVKNLNF